MQACKTMSKLCKFGCFLHKPLLVSPNAFFSLDGENFSTRAT